MQSDAVILVGVTGGIGSGKSSVCAEFEKIGRVVLYADVVAREIGDKDQAARKEIITAFGASAYGVDGLLDRKKMAERVFSSGKDLDRLNAIIHPRVAVALEKSIRELPESRCRPYVVVEAALVYESGMDEWLDLVVVVTADDDVRIRRVTERDGTPPEEVKRRIRSQIPQAQNEAKADFVLRNEGERDALAEKAVFLDRVISAMAVGGPGAGN